MAKPTYELNESEIKRAVELFNEGYGASTISLKLKTRVGPVQRALDRLGLRRDYKEAKAARGKLPMPVVRE